ncbi:MAG: hypothetical protein LBO09_04335 [Candidatus Peribacteria bacterium]|nr:hypothetical protein [Candidatus Peribacteria bacterium]
MKTSDKTSTSRSTSANSATTPAPAKTSPSTHPAPSKYVPSRGNSSRGSSYGRNAGSRDSRITSEIFLKHREAQATQSIADLKKLIKKDEIPVRIFAL